ncbi:glycosyltransferase family 2 protein [uncultured Modestobacter sp.]|uniref:glycosyltransferase family 2 protein n=1 Tax=uncultured Modestobacter sp. TaxID=380048 RepID=UPI0026181DFF|nr:glycosyltransferase [uncultured Modestobacter sp.]
MVAATVVISTFNRPGLLADAVASALAQTGVDHEVLVVDDASTTPVRLEPHPRLRVVRLETNGGVSAARNVGLAEARGRWITYLDDDDLLLPDHLEVALAALATTDLPAPVASLSGVEIVDREGRVVETRLPPTLPRGARFHLEDPPPGRSFALKSTLVVERAVLQEIGGWDESFRSRVQTELFLRLNPACSLLGLPTATYRRRRHDGPQVSGDPAVRARSMQMLEAKHRDLFAAAGRGRHAELVSHQAVKLWDAGHRGTAVHTWLRALRLHPLRAGLHSAGAVRARVGPARR